MAENDLLTDDIIAKEALMIVENNLVLTKFIAVDKLSLSRPSAQREGSANGPSLLKLAARS